MERLRLTEDGSHSLYNSQYNQHYHSVSGALKESRHIYMNLGLIPLIESDQQTIRVFEMGFGTVDGKFNWQGQVRCYAKGGGVDEVRKMTIVLSAQTPLIFALT